MIVLLCYSGTVYFEQFPMDLVPIELGKIFYQIVQYDPNELKICHPKLGRIKASDMFERTCMRVLSPSNEPPVREEDGSTASTASLPSFAIILCPEFGFDL